MLGAVRGPAIIMPIGFVAAASVGLAAGTSRPFPLLLVGLGLLAVPLAVAVNRWPHIYAVLAALVVPTGINFPSMRVPTPLGQLSYFHILALFGAIVVITRHPGRLSEAVKSPLGWFALAYAAVGTISALWTGQATSLYWVLTGGVLLLGLSVLLSQPYLSDPEEVARWTVIGGAVLAASVLIERLSGSTLAWLPTTSTGPPDPRFFRGSGLAGNPVVAGAALAVILAILIKARPFNGRTPNVLFAVLIGAGGVATGSRSALGGIALALLSVIVSRQEQAHRRMVAVLGAAVFSAVLLSQLDAIAERLGGSLTHNVSNEVRERNLALGWSAFRSEPLFGLGLGSYRNFTEERGMGVVPGGGQGALAQIDNTFLTLLAELGLIGATALAVVVVVVALPRHGSSGGRKATVLAPLITWCGVAYFFDALYHESMIFLFAVVVLMWRPPIVAKAPRGSAAASLVPSHPDVGTVDSSGKWF